MICPGEGKCHGPLGWCEDCGPVADVCDAVRCDAHNGQERQNRIGSLREEQADLTARLAEVNRTLNALGANDGP